MDPSFQEATTNIVAALKACAKRKDLVNGSRLHAQILRSGCFSKNCYIASSLVSMYAKCGALSKAAQVLDELPVRDSVAWSPLIDEYARQGPGEKAFECLQRMQSEGIVPDSVTLISILKACGSLRASYRGKLIHDHIMRQGLLVKDVALGNALVDMHAKCDDLAKASWVLDELPVRDAISWNTLIAEYSHHGQGEEALNLFEQMQMEGISTDSVTFSCALKACGQVGKVDKGQQIHTEIQRMGLLANDIILETALINMYVQCGELEKAAKVMSEFPTRDVVCWSALLSGYVQHGQGAKALIHFEQMQNEGITPNAVILMFVLKACGSIGAVKMGEQIHNEIKRQFLPEIDCELGNALVDMYAKCGELEKAAHSLCELPVRDVVTWNTLIIGYVQQGEGEEALHSFEQMQREGMFPDLTTFTCIVKACGRIGTIGKGEQIHTKIFNKGLLRSDLVLGTALVDMYVKCGALARAAGVLDELPVRDVVSWSALIAGYAQHGLGNEALKCSEQMLCEGLNPDSVNLACVLSACNRSGLMEKGQVYIATMHENYGIALDVDHYMYVVDFLGHVGEVESALALVHKIPFSNHFPALHALLRVCQEFGNLEVGGSAFDNAVQYKQLALLQKYKCLPCDALQ